MMNVGDVVNLIDAPEESLVIDVGCGNGDVTQAIKQKGYRVIGIDGSVNKIVSARKNNPKINFILSKPEEFKVSQNADVIFSDSLFHCVGEENQLQMLKNFNMNLKEGGTLVCEFCGAGSDSFIHYALWENFAEHSLSYELPEYLPSLDEYKEILGRAGFKVGESTVLSCKADENEASLEKWISENIKKPFECVEEKLKDKIIKKTVQDIKAFKKDNGNFAVDYVKIRIKAEKAAAA